ncbi:carbohydrate porin [Cerasicoccus frondis]|uniref:carbohydrate porin n=1 Tax=Cerasicoccus frondis TaxID=490090 RepID=UPI00285276FC|nr:carbohydrate porin [Cerasicoccus frondis]
MLASLANAKTDKESATDEDSLSVNTWVAGPYLFDYGGWRDDFAQQTGITFIGNYYVDVLGNPTGGLSQKVRYSTLGSIGVSLDFATMLEEPALTGWGFTVLGYNAEGRNLATDIGNAVNPSTLFSGDVDIGLAHLYLSYETDSFEAYAGRLTPEAYYAASPLWDYFVSLAFNDNPWNLSAADPNFSGFPGAVWMATGAWQATDQWQFSLGAANASKSTITDSSKAGVDFDFDSAEGTLFMGEVEYSWKAALFDETPLRGSIQIGGYYDTAAMPRLAPQPGALTKDGVAAAWVILEQQLIPGDTPDGVGLTGWALASWTGPQSVASAPWFYSLGFVYEGLIPGRPDDALAVGGSVVYFSDQLVGQNKETNIELTYLVQVTEWFSIQPDLQIILTPSGFHTIDNAVVVGVQCGVIF